MERPRTFGYTTWVSLKPRYCGCLTLSEWVPCKCFSSYIVLYLLLVKLWYNFKTLFWLLFSKTNSEYIITQLHTLQGVDVRTCCSAQWMWFFNWSLPESPIAPSHGPLFIHVIAALIHFSFLKHINFFLSHNFSVPDVLPDFSSRWFWVLPQHLLECFLPVHTGCTFCCFFARSFSSLGSGTLAFPEEDPGTEDVQNIARAECVLKGWCSDSAFVSTSLNCICMLSLLGEGKTQHIIWYSTASVRLPLCP